MYIPVSLPGHGRMIYRRLLLAAILGAPVWSSTPDRVTSRLMIHIPHNLYKEEGYDHRNALFGIPPYEGKIAQNVYYADSTLCDPNVDTSKGYPPRPVRDGKMEPWPSPFILMVDRGDCTFVKKVRNAQRAGAAAVIIADTTCLCSDLECVKSSSVTAACEANEPFMADDGSGSDVTIPSFLMFKRGADAVKQEVKANNPVQIELSWNLPNPFGYVEYDLWTTPTDPVGKSFLKSFKPAAVALGKVKAYFTPHMYIIDGDKSHCRGSDGQSMCYSLCTNHGRYCATGDNGISGAEVVKESLRRSCIWRQYGEADGIGIKWWDYVSKFMDLCDSPDNFSNEDCIKVVCKQSGVDYDMMNRCMADSGGLTADHSNAYLDKEIRSQLERGVVIIPSMNVNSARIQSALTFQTVFKAVCAEFDSHDEPHICQQCASCNDVFSCVTSHGQCQCQAAQAGSVEAAPAGSVVIVVSAPMLAISMAALILCFGIIFMVGFTRQKKSQVQMREQMCALEEIKLIKSVEMKDGEFS